MDVFVATALLRAEDIADMLRRAPAQARAVDARGLTALHWVTRADPNDGRAVEVARVLLDAGADVAAGAPAQEGMRPLHCAA